MTSATALLAVWASPVVVVLIGRTVPVRAAVAFAATDQFATVWSGRQGFGQDSPRLPLLPIQPTRPRSADVRRPDVRSLSTAGGRQGRGEAARPVSSARTGTARADEAG